MLERVFSRSLPADAPVDRGRREALAKIGALVATTLFVPSLIIGPENPNPEVVGEFAKWRYGPFEQEAQYDGVWHDVINMVGVQRLSEIGVQHETPTIADATRACEDPNIHMAEVDIWLKDGKVPVVRHTKWDDVKMTLDEFHKCIRRYDLDPHGKPIFVKYHLKEEHPPGSAAREMIAQYNTELGKPYIVNFSKSGVVSVSPFRDEGSFRLPDMAREMYEKFPGSILSTGTDVNLDEEVVRNIDHLNALLGGRFTFAIELRDCARQWKHVKELTEQRGVVVTVYDLSWRGSPRDKKVVVENLKPWRIIPDMK